MSKRVSLIDFAALWVICWTFIPFMQVGKVYRVITVVCAGFWLLMHLQSVVMGYSSFILIQLFAVALRVVLLYILRGSFLSAVTNSLQYIIVVVVCIMAAYYFDNDLNFLKKILPFIFLLLIVFSITTIKGTADNPYAARIANSEWLEERFEGNEMIGLYGYVYMCVFIEPVLLFSVLNKVSLGLWADRLRIIVLIVDFIMIMTAGYMIAIALTMIGCGLVWMNYKRNPVKTFIIFSALLVFVIFYKSFVSGIFTLLMQITKGNPVYYNKFSDLKSLFLAGTTSGDTVSGRFSNYLASFKNILNYPVLGSYIFKSSGGGGHSALLDAFGRFGWFVGGIFVYTYLVIPHRIGCGRSRWTIMDYVIMIQSVLFVISDPTFQEMGVAVYIVFPLVKRLAREQFELQEYTA